MTREQINDMYGSSQGDIDKVVETFEKFGLKAVKKNPLTNTVRLQGTIAQMQDAFPCDYSIIKIIVDRIIEDV